MSARKLECGMLVRVRMFSREQLAAGAANATDPARVFPAIVHAPPIEDGNRIALTAFTNRGPVYVPRFRVADIEPAPVSSIEPAPASTHLPVAR